MVDQVDFALEALSQLDINNQDEVLAGEDFLWEVPVENGNLNELGDADGHQVVEDELIVGGDGRQENPAGDDSEDEEQFLEDEGVEPPADDGIEADCEDEFETIVSKAHQINMTQVLENFATNLFCCSFSFVTIQTCNNEKRFLCDICFVRYCSMNNNGEWYQHMNYHETMEYANLPTHNCYSCLSSLYQICPIGGCMHCNK